MTPSEMMKVMIKAADLPEVKAALSAAAEEIDRLKHERDEWEERYWDLLSACGGTMP